LGVLNSSFARGGQWIGLERICFLYVNIEKLGLDFGLGNFETWD
jgi:hypothetical protein